MKKLLLGTLAGLALASSSAFAADMARPVYKAAPAPAPVTSWTGCYLGAGGGYSMYNAEGTQFTAAGAFSNQEGTSGGRGWMGQVQGGCDYQLSGALSNWVVGAFGDYDFMDVWGNHVGFVGNTGFGRMKENDAWSAGGRIGYLVTPTLLAYESGGYTETHFGQTNYSGIASGAPLGVSLNSQTYNGWFLGSGFEYSFTWLPIQGLFLKTEYRFSQYQSKNVNDVTGAGAIVGVEAIHPYVQTVSTELVYRFNWH